jgi:undecaprenyl diphosphate synthase
LERRRDALHVAIIMDGNGRWAQARGCRAVPATGRAPRAVRRVVEAAPAQGIGVLTLYAFSSDNWKRPGTEVRALLRLLESYLRTELASCVEQGVRIEVLGRRDRLPERVQDAIGGGARRRRAPCCACGWRSTTRRGTPSCGRRRSVRAAAWSSHGT